MRSRAPHLCIWRLCTVQLQWDNQVPSPCGWVLGILLPWKEVCGFHAMINPVNCRLLPNEWCSCHWRNGLQFISQQWKTTEWVEEHTTQQLWPYTACRERQRQGTGKSLTLHSNLRLLWAGCPRSQRSVRSFWQIQPRCSWHRSAWSQRIPSHPQSAKERGRQSPYEARQRSINTQANTDCYLSIATFKTVQNLQNFARKEREENLLVFAAFISSII